VYTPLVQAGLIEVHVPSRGSVKASLDVAYCIPTLVMKIDEIDIHTGSPVSIVPFTYSVSILCQIYLFSTFNKFSDHIISLGNDSFSFVSATAYKILVSFTASISVTS